MKIFQGYIPLLQPLRIDDESVPGMLAMVILETHPSIMKKKRTAPIQVMACSVVVCKCELLIVFD
jgi:hypothetical protein